MVDAIPTPERVMRRLMSNFHLTETGCWVSDYSTASHGYSQIGWNEGGTRTVRLGHRVSWEWVNGPIPDGMTIDHLCRVRRCINPLHLQLLSNLENARGGGGRHVNPPQPTGRQCANGGHELLLYATGSVACRECQAERARRKYPNRVLARSAA